MTSFSRIESSNWQEIHRVWALTPEEIAEGLKTLVALSRPVSLLVEDYPLKALFLEVSIQKIQFEMIVAEYKRRTITREEFRVRKNAVVFHVLDSIKKHAQDLNFFELCNESREPLWLKNILNFAFRGF